MRIGVAIDAAGIIWDCVELRKSGKRSETRSEKRLVVGVEFACKHGYHGNPPRTARSDAFTHEKGTGRSRKNISQTLD